VVAVSYDAKPGQASRVAARAATASAVAFPGSPLPRARVTGAPVRSAIVNVDRGRDRDEARRALGLPLDRFVLFVVGGSLGSGPLNAVTAAFVSSHNERADLAVRQVVGVRNAGAAESGRDDPTGIVHQVVAYDEHIELSYAAADLVLARAGASTVAELAVTGTPSILVPWPAAAEDHQSANAQVLGRVGGAIVMAEAAFDATRLASEIDRFQADPPALTAMGAAARAVGRPEGATAIATLVEEVASR
jgi:UDP-N-acetylglucosamine--N-acetylmuramyl-(pentapeptide) pyrophosphoryl-undecaprenol N-acetylglucosamine transferase